MQNSIPLVRNVIRNESEKIYYFDDNHVKVFDIETDKLIGEYWYDQIRYYRKTYNCFFYIFNSILF